MNQELIEFSYNSVPSVEFGLGKSATLFASTCALGAKKPLFITDAGVLSLGLLDACLSNFRENGVTPTVYSGVQADPPESNVNEAVELALSNNCDMVIGFGGGSTMDVAKLVAVLAFTDNSVESSGMQSSYLMLQDLYGVEQFESGRLPLIQVPTTAGTGSEATAVSIITTGESTKSGVVSSILLADKIVLDPALTVGLPSHITAATGIDAMVHAIEAYTSKRLKNPLSDMAAAKALVLLAANIEKAVADGSDIEARSNMLLGAMLAGQAFANAPVGGVHALAYPIGGIFHVAHGLSNSLVLPHVLRFNAQAADDLYSELLAIVAADSKARSGACISMSSSRSNFKYSAGHALATYFEELAVKFALPTRLRDVGIDESHLDQLAEQAMLQQRLLINNPCEINYADARSIYSAAM